MKRYQFVNVRFNLDKEDEKALFEELNSRNRAGNIKKILKEYLITPAQNPVNKTELDSLIQEILERELDRRKEEKAIEDSSMVKINIGGREHVL